MRIEYDIKLGFKDDVSPKTFSLKSRSQVSLEREFIFRNSKKLGVVFPLSLPIWIQ